VGPRHTKKFYESELIPAVCAAEFYRIHALSDEMQAQTTWPHILKRAPAQFCAVYLPASIDQNDFESFPVCSAPACSNATKRNFDGPFCVSGIGMTNDICQCFVDPEHHGPAFRLGKPQPLGELRHRSAHHAERLWITAQFHF
jgi:hypothetical protein